MKYIGVLIFLMLAVQSAYAQDVLITKINESQYGAQNGQVSVKINNIGTGIGQNKPPFIIRLCFGNSGCETVINETGVARFENLKSQEYCLYVTNGDLCAFTECFKLCPDKMIDGIVTTNHLPGPPEVLGSMEITPLPSSSIGYSWQVTNPFGSFSTTGSGVKVNDLKARPKPYTVVITDNYIGCTSSMDFMINKCLPEAHNINAVLIKDKDPSTTCSEDGKMTATIKLPGLTGVPPFTFTWGSNQGFSATTIDAVQPFESVLTNLAVGVYTVTITDYNCSTTVTSSVVLPPKTNTGIAINYTASMTHGCLWDLNITPSGGTGPYKVKWSHGVVTEDLTNLPPNSTYSVIVFDKNGCSATKTITLGPPPNITFTSTTVAACGSGLGGITITSINGGGESPHTYLWSTGETTASISGLSLGNYSVTITDANQCTGSGIVKISDNLTTAASSLTNFCEGPNLGTSLGSITATAPNGIPPFTFNWSTGASTASITGLQPGEYKVTITDSRGCTGAGSFDIYNTYYTLAQFASSVTSNLDGVIDGCINLGFCEGSDPVIVGNFFQLDFIPNDIYCPCQGGGILTCPYEPVIQFDVPPTTSVDCEEVLGANPPSTTDPNCIACFTYPFNNQYSSTSWEGSWIHSNVDPKYCTTPMKCSFAPGLISGIPNLPVQVFTSGLMYCGIGFTGSPSDRVEKDSNERLVLDQLDISPNPAKDFVSIYLNAPDEKEYHVDMFDVGGKRVLAQTISATKGNNNFTLLLRDTPSGTYAIHVYDNNNVRFVKKLVVSRN